MKMLKTILKQFVHKPVTTTFPAEPPKQFEATRGHIVFDSSKCTSCTVCMKRCPSQAITVDREAKTWSIDQFKCVVCGSCIDLCKFGVLSMDNAYPSSSTLEERTVETYQITYVKPERPAKKEE